MMIPYTSVAAPRFTDAEGTRIDCLVMFPSISLEPIAYTAAQVDPGAEHSEEIFARCLAGEFGPVAPWEEIQPVDLAPPAPARDRRFSSVMSGLIVRAASDHAPAKKRKAEPAPAPITRRKPEPPPQLKKRKPPAPAKKPPAAKKRKPPAPAKPPNTIPTDFKGAVDYEALAAAVRAKRKR